jgi:hypothetical protein
MREVAASQTGFWNMLARCLLALRSFASCIPARFMYVPASHRLHPSHVGNQDYGEYMAISFGEIPLAHSPLSVDARNVC